MKLENIFKKKFMHEESESKDITRIQYGSFCLIRYLNELHEFDRAFNMDFMLRNSEVICLTSHRFKILRRPIFVQSIIR